MKRLAAFIFAAGGLAAGVLCTSAVSASAAINIVTLSAPQTLALFGTSIPCQYRDNIGALIDSSFEFYSYGFKDTTPYLIYKSQFEDTPYTGYDFDFTLQLVPHVSLSGIDMFHMVMGVKTAGSRFNVSTQNVYPKNRAVLYSDVDTGSMHTLSFYPFATNQGGGFMRILTYSITPENEENPWYFTHCDIDVSATDNSDSIFNLDFFGSDSSGVGFYQTALAEVVDGQYYFMIGLPTLSETYVVNHNGSESSGGGSESSGGGSESSGGGYDGPDYTDQLALILAKLDLIINNDFNFDVDLSADLSGVESRLDGVNSRLDGVNSRLDGSNSRLDGNNSRLDGVNSRLDGVNSRLDNISGELHEMNSAPSETIPNTGGENSEFEHQAEMYMSDFRSEYEDSENQVFEVIDKGTGFLGFVREIIITSHLAQILPLLALLFIAHYVIFERGG